MDFIPENIVFYSLKDVFFLFCVDPNRSIYRSAHMHTCCLSADKLYWLRACANEEQCFTTWRYLSQFGALFFLSASFTEIHQNSNNFKLKLSVTKHPSHETDVKPNATSNTASALLGFTC